MREVVVTGIGPLLPGCASRAQLWRHLIEGRSQLCFEAAPTNDGSSWPVGRIKDFDAGHYLAALSPQHWKKYTRDQQLYVASLVLAREDAHLELDQVDPERVGIFDGTSRGSFDAWYERIREEATRSPEELYTHREHSQIFRPDFLGFGSEASQLFRMIPKGNEDHPACKVA